MEGIVSEGRKPCQPSERAQDDEAREKIFLPSTVPRLNFVV